MEQDKKITTLQKGLLISGLLIVISVGFYLAGFQTQKWTQWIGYLIFMSGVMWACISYGKENDNMISFGNIFSHGFKVSSIITCMMIAFSVVFVLLYPEIKETAMDMARQEMEKNEQITEEQIEMALSMTQKYFTVFMIGGALVGYLIMGAIASLIGAAVTKKNPSTPFA